jgi:ribonuclease VapC
MIVIDTSALVAIFRKEPEGERFADIVAEADRRLLPVHVYLESVMVTSRQPAARDWIDRFIEQLRIAVTEIDQVVGRIAADAFLAYGKGRGHPAQLNFADCMSYAVAKRFRAPLLYKGDDFGRTDIESAATGPTP